MPDVRLPDGTVVRNVPEGTTRAQLMARLQKANGPDRSGLAAALDAGVRGFSDMATFGLGDKIVAGLNSVIPLDKATNPNIKSIWETGDIGSAFRNNLDQEERIAAQDEKQHGVARGVGQFLGGVVGPVPGKGLIGKAVAKAGKYAFPARVVAEGATQGLAYGAGSGDSTDIATRARNALDEGVKGGAGALVGASVVRGAGRLISPKVSDAVSRLAQRGIVMTPGQRGGPVRRFVEEVAQSVPVAGQVVTAAKDRGIQQFNRALYDEGLAPIGVKTPNSIQPGRQMADFAQNAVSNAYDDALNGLDVHPDQAFAQGLSTVSQRAQSLPGDLGSTYTTIMDQEVAPLLDGKVTLDGRTLQKISQVLQKRAAKADGSTSPLGDMLGDALREVRSHFIDLAMRGAPERTNAFLAANDAEADLSRVYDAASKAKGEGLTTPRAFSSAVAKRGYGTTAKRVAAGDARMQELADAASTVLPDRLPNSGTADRGAMLAGGTALLSGGAGAVNPALAIPAAAVAPYVPGIDRVLQSLALRGQGDTARHLAEQIRKRGYIGGKIGAPLALAIGD